MVIQKIKKVNLAISGEIHELQTKLGKIKKAYYSVNIEMNPNKSNPVRIKPLLNNLFSLSGRIIHSLSIKGCIFTTTEFMAFLTHFKDVPVLAMNDIVVIPKGKFSPQGLVSNFKVQELVSLIVGMLIHSHSTFVYQT